MYSLQPVVGLLRSAWRRKCALFLCIEGGLLRQTVAQQRKNKQMKRLLMFIASLAVGIPLVADTEIVNGIAWSYRIEGGNAIIQSSSGAAIPTSTKGAITVPTVLGGYTVVKIGDEAFHSCEGVTQVTIPNGIKEIGEWVFTFCGASTINLPNSLTTIGNSAFQQCGSFGQEGGLTSITIPDSVTSMGTAALSNCECLEKVVIGKGLKSIPDHAFWNCIRLSSIDLPEGVIDIGDWAFQANYCLEELVLPQSVSHIGNNAFSSCSNLERLKFEGNAPVVGSDIFEYVPSSCEVLVRPDSSGWGVSIPGTWNGLSIRYQDVVSTCTVTFDANGGSGSPTTWTVNSGAAVGDLPTPTQSGYTFDGWWTAASGGTQVTASTIVNANVTYYAHWTKISQPDAASLTKTVSAEAGTYSFEVTLPSGGVTYSGFTSSATWLTFASWRMNGDEMTLSFKVTENTSTSSRTATLSGTVINNETLTFTVIQNGKSGGGSGTPDKQKGFGPGEASDFQISSSERGFVVGVSGLTWSDFPKRAYDGFNVFTDSRIVDREKGSGGFDAPDCDYCEPYSYVDLFVWTGWAKSVGFTDEDAFGSVVSGSGADAYGNLFTLTEAYMEDISTGATFAQTLANRMAGADRIMVMYVLFDNYTWYGEYFPGTASMAHAIVCCGYSYDPSKKLTDPTALKGLFIIEADNDRENGNGGASAPDTITYCPVTWDSSRKRYSIRNIFGAVGYFDDSVMGEGGTMLRTKDPVSLHKSVDGGFSDGGSGGGDAPAPVNYTVTFNANGGSGGTTRTVTSGAAVGALPTPTRSGYTFEGWFTDANGGSQVSSSTKITGNVTYYAHWLDIGFNYGGKVRDSSFSQAFSEVGVLYDAKGKIVGTVELKFGKINKMKQTVKVSGTATVIVDGKARKVSAKSVDLGVVYIDGWLTRPVMFGTLEFKAPIGKMTFKMEKWGGVFTLKNSSYEMVVMRAHNVEEYGYLWLISNVSVVGGAMPNGTALFNVNMSSVPNFGADGVLLSDALPSDVPIMFQFGRWSFGKSPSLKYTKDRATGKYKLVGLDDPTKPNVSGLKLVYTAKTGLFKGSYKIYTTTGGTKPKLKRFTVNVIGFVVDGKGYGEATLKRPAGGPWAVTVQ